MNSVARIAGCFAAGAVGGAVNGVAVWAIGAIGITTMLGFAMAPGMSLPFMLPRLLYGGLWGFLFLLPFWEKKPYQKGLLLSLAPTAYMLLKVFPEVGAGAFGLGKGPGAPYFVLFFNFIWGLAAGWVVSLFPARQK